MGVYNQSHQRDTTAYRALCNIEHNAQSRYERLIADVHMMAHRLGLRIVGKIRVQDIKSGQEYRS